MNARTLAEDAATRYLENIDPCQPHSKNVNSHLRSLVLTLTKSILCDDVVVFSQEDSLVQPSEDDNNKSNTDDPSENGENKENQTKEEDDDTSVLTKRSVARMEAFLKNCVFAIPDESLPNILSASLHAMQHHPKNYYHQFLHPDISVRLEIYFRSLKRVRDYNYNHSPKENDSSKSQNSKTYVFNDDTKYECLISLEPPRVLQARTDALVRSFVRTASSVQIIRPLLTAMVLSLSMEVLAVDVVGKEITQKISRLVSEYEHQTSFASLAFLSSPEKAADTHLTPLVLSYLKYLQSTYKTHESSSEIESMLSNVLSTDLRYTFHTVEFQSVGHLLQVCDSYASVLQNIQLPPIRDNAALMAKCTNPKEVKQALKDLRREVITVNGNVVPPAHNLKELVQLLSETMNARTTALYDDEANTKNNTSKSGRKVPSSAVRIESDTDEEELNKTHGTASGNEGDSEGHGRHRAKVRQNRGGGRSSVKRRSFDGATVDKMTARLLIAAGRSGTGADAYFVIQDLFGGDGVIVVPSRVQPKKATSRTPGSAPRKKNSVGTIDIIVRLSSVTIKVHAHYDVYPEKSLTDESCEPLIQLYSTTTETISLQEVRVKEPTPNGTESKEESKEENTTSETDKSFESSVLVLKEKQTEDTGRRTLSIRPASYKKVVLWNTPS